MTEGPRDAGVEPAGGARVPQAGEARSSRVESLRALAALAVLLSHAFVYSYGVTPSTADRFWHRVALEAGFAGVELFFVLSGYLLFWPFARSFITAERIDLRRYARNRAVRILPLYLAVLVVLLVVQNGGGNFGQWWRFATFTENFSTATFGTVDAPMWSLAVEVQFYIVLPLLAMLLLRVSRGSRGTAAGILIALALASIVLRQVVVWHTNLPGIAWQYSLPSLFFFFAAGMLLALTRAGWVDAPPAWLRGPLAHSSVWALASLPLWLLLCWRLDYEPAAALAAVLLVGACVLPLRRGVFVRLTESPALAGLGLASYSLYLWHVPILIALAAGDLSSARAPLYGATPGAFLGLLGLGLVCSIALALASYRMIELPALALRRPWARSLPASTAPARPAPATVAPTADPPS